jgi:hypothetical protein
MKINVTVFYLTALLSLTACGGKKEAKTKEDAKSDTTNNIQGNTDEDSPFDATCDYYVDSLKAYRMIKKYDSVFLTYNPTKTVWIEKQVLVGIHNFLEANKATYDGVRFTWVKESGTITLLVSPTVSSATGVQYQRHTNKYGVPIPLAGDFNPRNIKINLPDTTAVRIINQFGKYHRMETTEGNRETAPENYRPLSASIWLHPCKIEAMYDLFTTHGAALDGLMAFSAAYYEDDPRRYQRNDREFEIQSTLIFIPTRKGVPDWSVVRPEQKWKDSGGFNHGELCPKICD